MTKEERKIYHRKYYLKNKDKINERIKNYVLNNPEKRKERGRKYYLKNIRSRHGEEIVEL